MPIYEYLCKHCNYITDKLEKINDNTEKKCPRCETYSLKKIVSASNFQLKGSGWYKTDYKRNTDEN